MNKPRRGRRPAVADARGQAARAVLAVTRDGRSLTDCLPPLQEALGSPEERGLAQELAFGTLRWYPRLAFWLSRLLERPLKARDRDVEALLLVGLYQCSETRVPDHAAVSSIVNAARGFTQPWASGMANAVLRRFLREQVALRAAAEQDRLAHWAHPAWLLDALEADWPGQWQAIAQANNARPPMTLRVNRRLISRKSYHARLDADAMTALPHPDAEDALELAQPVAVGRLPGFEDGLVSVQDAAGQLAADLLQLAPGQRVLDLCAAPGSKTCHMLEREPGLAEVVAVDVEPGRLERLRQNLQRLQLSATVLAGDGTRPDDWWDGRAFQRILLDAPCSATGVIRRHPDIKLLRRSVDIPALVALQARMLDAVWPLLEPGGMLVYATCSMLRAENRDQLEAFLRRRPDAEPVPITGRWGMPESVGRQIAAGTAGMDGFYYAVLRKQ